MFEFVKDNRDGSIEVFLADTDKFLYLAKDEEDLNKWLQSTEATDYKV